MWSTRSSDLLNVLNVAGITECSSRTTTPLLLRGGGGVFGSQHGPAERCKRSRHNRVLASHHPSLPLLPRRASQNKTTQQLLLTCRPATPGTQSKTNARTTRAPSLPTFQPATPPPVRLACRRDDPTTSSPKTTSQPRSGGAPQPTPPTTGPQRRKFGICSRHFGWCRPRWSYLFRRDPQLRPHNV